MQLSIIIPTFNRAALLRKTIPALMEQKVSPGSSYEVIFVSNGSSDNTESLLKKEISKYSDKLRYIWIEPTGGPAAPRNTGIRAARGDIIVILDDDVLPDPELVQSYIDYHHKYPEPEAAAVGEAYIPKELLKDPLSVFHEYSYENIRNAGVVSYIYFWTCNVSAKRSLLLKAGLFDERFLWNEDIILGHALDQQGMQLRFCDGASGAHHHHLDKSRLKARALQIGRWIWATTQVIHDPILIDRYGVLSWRLGPYRFTKRLLNRTAFRLLDNPITSVILRAFGAEGDKRTWISDLYYYLFYRRHIVAGYLEAKSTAKAFRSKGIGLEPTELVRQMA